MKFIYPAVIGQKEDGGYRAHFPDLAQCVVEADSLEEVIEKAKEAEFNWISAELEEEGAELPPRSEVSEIALKEGQILRNISTTIKFFEGWEE